MSKATILVTLLILPTIAFAVGITYDTIRTDSGYNEAVVEYNLEAVGFPSSLLYNDNEESMPIPYNDAEIIWSHYEYESPPYSAFLHDVDVSGNGEYIFGSWCLNDEKWVLYTSDGDETPVWSYDILQDIKYFLLDWTSLYGDISEDGSVIAGCLGAFTTNTPDVYRGEVYKFNNTSNVPDWIYVLPATSTDPEECSRTRGVKVTADGSKIICLVENRTGDPAYPHQIYIFNSSSSTPIKIIDLTSDVENDDPKSNGMDITPDGSLIAYATRTHIYVYNDSGDLVDSISVANENDYSPAISPDGEWLAYGNFRGKLFLLQWDGSEYVQQWVYTIPPVDYYP